MFRKTVEDFVSEAVTRDGEDRVVVQGDFLGDLCSVIPVRSDCMCDMDQLKRSRWYFLGRLTGHIQGAFGVVENWFYDTIEELDTLAL